MTFESALAFFFAVLVFGVTPGPGVFALMAKALVQGSRSCFAMALGMTISDILYLIAACLGFAVIASKWSEVFTVIRIVGTVYLVYLGWKMWNAPLVLDPEDSTGQKRNALASFIQGFLISASNPKVILFYIAFLPTFMDLTVLTGADIALASVLTLFALMIGMMSIAIFAAKAREWFKSELAVKRLNRSAGSMMMGAGAFLFAKN
ncbi:threonine transporter [Oleiphilus sp. HI0125]|uniref:LysE family translocator n=2 Tax=Oleiphilus sp. HI0125 TaxID=1822266 RepID=UPI0007C297CB|nr:LysE family translocator [Oleiphilus sp. HI0125]KZZ57119.1 threonine transporter [Oleiphilus sp. HI0125]